jgi:VanZ family protein
LNTKTKHRLLATLFFTWLIALLALTYWPNMPEMDIEEKWFRTDYLGHFGFYAMLVIFFLLWQRGRNRKVTIRTIVLAGLGGIALGAITEFSQLFIPDRTLNPVDMLFNCLGIVAGAITFAAFRRREHRAKGVERKA